MKNFPRSVIIYLFIAYAIAWIVNIGGLLAGFDPNDPTFQNIGLISNFAPFIAVLIVQFGITKEGFKGLGLHPKIRRNWAYYLIAWLFPIVVGPIIILLASATGISNPDFTFIRAFEQSDFGATSPPELLTSLPSNLLLPIPFMFGALGSMLLLWGEEIGWRGFMQPRIFPDNQLLASIITGIAWALWHLPLILVGFTFGPDVNIIVALVVYTTSLTLWSIVFGWLRIKSDSMWVPTLGHAAYNTFGGTMLASLFFGGPNWEFVAYGGILSWIPLAIICGILIYTGQFKTQES